MAEPVVDQRRVKVSATVDPALMQAVDAYVAENPEFNRSRVFEEALRLWQDRQLELALEAQYSAPRSQQEEDERAAWRRIRHAAAQRIFSRDDHQ